MAFDFFLFFYHWDDVLVSLDEAITCKKATEVTVTCPLFRDIYFAKTTLHIVCMVFQK